MTNTEPLQILLVGYGKMGQVIETVAKERGHSVSAIVSDGKTDLHHIARSYKPTVAFEFTQPSSAIHNIETLIKSGIPTICGSTGWLEHWAQIEALVKLEHGSFFYASNFSLGMNLTFRLAEVASRFLRDYPEYEVEISEIHHLEKKDKPSGTAITLAQKVIHQIKRKSGWELEGPSKLDRIGIQSIRQDKVPGTHILHFRSPVEDIEIKHTAHNRSGFALGAVLAAEWLQNKKGVFGMDDLLDDVLNE